LVYLFESNGKSMLVKSQVKYIQSLGHKKFREAEGAFVAEGPKLVGELLRSKNVELLHLFAVKEWVEEQLPRESLALKISPVVLQKKELERVSFLATPNEVLAVFKKPSFAPPALEARISLALDDIQDPGNLGTMLRIADWFGLEQIICSEETADVFNPKVVQATMGSIVRVQVLYVDLKQFFSQYRDIPLYATVLDGETLFGFPKTDHGIILIGNESKGINGALHPFIKHRITIPRKGHAESLNAAVAAGIILSHLVPVSAR
jgi:RNA methyltransferase, TrmH family